VFEQELHRGDLGLDHLDVLQQARAVPLRRPHQSSNQAEVDRHGVERGPDIVIRGARNPREDPEMRREPRVGLIHAGIVESWIQDRSLCWCAVIHPYSLVGRS
jgi:hypothetical protein